VNECTGVDLPADKRTEAQRRNLANIVAVVRIPESSLQSHMNWATFMFADIVHNRLGGRNPFGNEGVRYAGSDDDAALNAGVARYRADPEGVAALAADAEPTGRTAVPTLTTHAIGDPTAFVENESAYRVIREHAGTQDLLAQNFTDETVHSYLSTPEYAALMDALLDWVDRGRKPDAADIASRCAKYVGRYGESCRFQQAYRPASMDARSYPRKQPDRQESPPLVRGSRDDRDAAQRNR
jgi:alpha-beta hydrolase superfamily lysophospholipase